MTELDGEPLTAAERAFAERLRELFARVDARAPERGIMTLLRRARLAAAAGRPPDEALDAEYQGALKRTTRRQELAARSSCALDKRTR